MTLSDIHRNGYYDDTGNWQRTKFCFVDCGVQCDCGPPFNLHYSRAHDKRIKKAEPEEVKHEERPV